MSYDIGPKIGIEGEAQFRQAIRDINTTMKTLGTEMGVVVSQFDKTDKSEAALTARGEVLAKQYDAQKAKLDQMKQGLEAARAKYGETDAITQKWQQTVNRAQAELNDLGRAIGENERDLTNVRRGYDEAGNALDEFGQAAEDAGGKTGGFGTILKANLTSQAIIDGVRAMAAAIKDALSGFVDAGASFEASMSQVAATMGMSPEEIAAGSEAFETLEQAAKEAGATTKFSATESAEALNYLALAGYDANKSSEALPAVLNLAAAGGLDLAYASDLATDAMAALGIEASREDLTEFGDKMARTASKANTSVAQLGEATLTVGGTAKGLAGGVTELNTSLGVLANRGIKGAEGGTALRNIILSLSAPTDKAADKMKALGLEVYDAEGNLRPLNDVFKDLDSSMSAMTEGEKTQALNEIFNKVDLKSAQAMLAGCGEEFDSLSAAIADSGGAMQDMADVQIDNLKGAVTIMESSMEGFGIAVYESIGGPLRDMAEQATEYIGQLTQAFEEGGFEGLVAQAGTILGEVMEGLVSALPGIVDGVEQIIMALVNGIGAALPTLVPAAAEAVTTIVQGLLDNAPQVMEGALGLIQGLAEGVLDAIPVLLESVPTLITSWVDYVLGSIPQIIQTGIDLITALVEDLPTIISTIVEVLPEIVTGIIDTLLDNLPLIIDAGVQLLTALVENLPAIILGIVEAIPELVQGIADGLINNIDKIIEAGVMLFVALVTDLPAIILGIVKAVPKIVSGIVDAFGSLMGTVADIGLNLVKGIASGITDAAGWLMDQIKGFFGGVVDGVKDFLGIHSPSTVFAELGGFSVEGFALGMKNSKGKAIKTAEELSKAILDTATAWVKDRKAVDELAADEEVRFWEALKQVGGLRAGELKTIDQNLYKARAQASKDSYEASKGWIDEEVFYNRLSADQVVEAWERVAQRGNLSAEEQKKAEKELYKAREAAAKESAQAQEAASKDAYNASKKWIDNEKFYQRMSAQEEVEAWERVVDRHNLAADQQMEAERNLFTARQALLKEQTEAEKKVYDQQKKACDEYQKAVESRRSSLEGFAGLFDAIDKKTAVSGRQLLKNLRDQVSAFEGWQADMETLAERGVTGPLLDELAEMGPKAAQEIKALTKLSDKQLQEYADLFARKGQLAAEQAEKEIPAVQVPVELEDLDTERVKELGAAIVSALTGAGEAGTAGTETVSAYTAGVDGQAEQVRAAGAGLVAQMGQSVRDTVGQLVQAANEAVEAVCGVFASSDYRFFRAGREAMAGLRQGLETEGQRAVATARRIADAIIAEMRRALDIHSPSRKMAELVGVPTAQGFMAGFEDEMEAVKGRMRRSTDEVMGSLPVYEGAGARSGPEAAVESMVNALAPLLRQNGGDQTIIVPVYLDKKQIAQVVYDPLIEEGRRRGGAVPVMG